MLFLIIALFIIVILSYFGVKYYLDKKKKAETDKIASDKVIADKIASDTAEQAAIAKVTAERTEAQKIAAESAAAEKAAADRIAAAIAAAAAAEKTAADRIAAANAATAAANVSTTAIPVSYGSKPYLYNDFVVWTANGTDLAGQPMIGTLTECENKCDTTPGCVGFSRAKGAADTVSSQCYLKQNLNSSRSNGDATWKTYTKYLSNDFIVWTADGTDLPGQPIKGTLPQCQKACDDSDGCIAFSREKAVKDTDIGACYLKKNLISGRTLSEPTWSTYTKYRLNDFVVWTAAGTDLAGQPMKDTLYNCQKVCNNNQECLGFSRAKAAKDTDISECYLKKNLTNPSYGNGTWYTYTK